MRTAEQEEFLRTVMATSTDKVENLAAGSVLSRAQIGHEWRPEEVAEGEIDEFPSQFSPERMKPLRHRAFEGRVNPKGIPCLYLATQEATAIAEVRPWVGALVSVAQVKVNRDLRIINCTTDDRRLIIYSEEPGAKERERAVWQDIDDAFSRPVSLSDDVASYAPTQIMAEWFRQQALDGVAYRSSLGSGHNVALFDLNSADIINCTLVEIRRIKLEYDEAANRYFVAKHYPELGKRTPSPPPIAASGSAFPVDTPDP